MEKKHVTSFIIQVASGLFVVAVIIIIEKFKKKKEPEIKKEASQVLGVGSVNSTTNKMKTFFTYKTKFTGNIANDLFNFMHEAEGGLDKDKNDNAYTEALKIPGFPVGGYHTNVGITYTTYYNNASKLGYDKSYLSFTTMTPAIWKKIFDVIYFAPFSKTSKYPILDYVLVEWGWGSGIGGASSELKKFLKANNNESLDGMVSVIGLPLTFQKMIEERMRYYKSISTDQDKVVSGKVVKAKNDVYLDGWNNRAANFYNIFSGYAK